MSVEKLSGNPTNWKKIIYLLSLDFMAPFYKKVGLIFLDSEKSIPIFRKLIKDNEQIIDNSNFFSFPQNIIQDLKESIKVAFDEETKLFFQYWATNVYTLAPADQPQWEGWQQAFLFLMSSKPLPRQEWKDLNINPEIEQQIFSLYKTSQDNSDVCSLYQSQAKKELLKWDVQVFEKENFVLEKDETYEKSWLFQHIDATAENYRFQQFLRQISPLLSYKQRLDLWNVAKKLLAEHNIWFADNLEQLDTLTASCLIK